MNHVLATDCFFPEIRDSTTPQRNVSYRPEDEAHEINPPFTHVFGCRLRHSRRASCN
jgi:hypothetical protein